MFAVARPPIPYTKVMHSTTATGNKNDSQRKEEQKKKKKNYEQNENKNTPWSVLDAPTHHHHRQLYLAICYFTGENCVPMHAYGLYLV